jgi:hypothetical protein
MTGASSSRAKAGRNARPGAISIQTTKTTAMSESSMNGTSTSNGSSPGTLLPQQLNGPCSERLPGSSRTERHA